MGVASLTFFIGAALRNIPVRGYRAAGSVMMEDGFIALALISTINVVVIAGYVVASVIYGGQSMNAAYDGFYAWLIDVKNGAFSFLAVVALVQWSLGLANTAVGMFLPGSAPWLPLSLVFQSQVGPWLSMVQATYTLMVALEQVAHILQEKMMVFVAFGSILYAFPRRLTRTAGGAMIAGSLVFYFGLPLMPAFVNAYSTATYSQIQCSIQTPDAPDCPNLSSFSPELITSLAALLNVNASAFIWLRLILPTIWITILSLASAGVGRLLGGYVQWLMPSF